MLSFCVKCECECPQLSGSSTPSSLTVSQLVCIVFIISLEKQVLVHSKSQVNDVFHCVSCGCILKQTIENVEWKIMLNRLFQTCILSLHSPGFHIFWWGWIFFFSVFSFSILFPCKVLHWLLIGWFVTRFYKPWLWKLSKNKIENKQYQVVSVQVDCKE